MCRDQDVKGLEEPLDQVAAKELIRRILSHGSLVPPRGHALREMEKDDLSTVDVTNVLRGGVVRPAEFENGCWRYRVETQRIVVVVGFRSSTELYVATAWRLQK